MHPGQDIASMCEFTPGLGMLHLQVCSLLLMYLIPLSDMLGRHTIL